jgi:hypothetical protein
VLAVATVLALESAPARADGDPASDILVSANLSLPYPPPSGAAQQELKRAVDAVYRHRHRIKVAVIASEQDLGAIPSLFGKPADYARFLGQELSYVYIGPLLIVISGPTFRLSKTRRHALLPTVQAAATEIEQALAR